MSDDQAPSPPLPRIRAASPSVGTSSYRKKYSVAYNVINYCTSPLGGPTTPISDLSNLKCTYVPRYINFTTCDLSNLKCTYALLYNNFMPRDRPARGPICKCLISYMSLDRPPRRPTLCNCFNSTQGDPPIIFRGPKLAGLPGPTYYDIQIKFTLPGLFPTAYGVQDLMPAPVFNSKNCSIKIIMPFRVPRLPPLRQFTFARHLTLHFHWSLARCATARTRLPISNPVSTHQPTAALLLPTGGAGRAVDGPVLEHLYEYYRHSLRTSVTSSNTSASPRLRALCPTGPLGPPVPGVLADRGAGQPHPPRGFELLTRADNSAGYAEIHPNQPP